MTVKQIKKARKPNSRKSNPGLLSRVFGKSATRRDGTSIMVLDGTVYISGKKFKEIGSELYDILEKELKTVKLEFQPLGSNKKYILNRPVDKNIGDDEDEPRAKRRDRILRERGILS